MNREDGPHRDSWQHSGCPSCSPPSCQHHKMPHPGSWCAQPQPGSALLSDRHILVPAIRGGRRLCLVTVRGRRGHLSSRDAIAAQFSASTPPSHSSRRPGTLRSHIRVQLLGQVAGRGKKLVFLGLDWQETSRAPQGGI